MAVRVCSCVSVCVRQHTHDIRGCPSVHISARWSLDSARWPFFWTVRVILALVGCLFRTHRMSVGVHQHTQDVRGCPCVSVCVRQHTQDVRGCPLVHISARWPFLWTVWVILSQVGCLFSTHRTSMGVRQHTQDVWGCLWLSASTHRTSGAVCGCLSAHTGRSWVSVSTHRTFVSVRKHTQDVRGCTCVSVSTHRTFVAVHQYTYQHVGPWTLHAVPSRGLFG